MESEVAGSCLLSAFHSGSVRLGQARSSGAPSRAMVEVELSKPTVDRHIRTDRTKHPAENLHLRAVRVSNIDHQLHTGGIDPCRQMLAHDTLGDFSLSVCEVGPDVRGLGE